MTTSRKKKQKQEPLIYCGPSLPNGEMNRYKIYKNGAPKHIEDHVKKCPAISHLFIPVSQFAAAKKKLAQRGSKESAWYDQIKQYLEGSDA